MIPIRDTLPRRNPPIATLILILINCVVFLFELTMSEPTLEQFFYLFGIVPARFTHPDWAYWMGFPANSYWRFFDQHVSARWLAAHHRQHVDALDQMTPGDVISVFNSSTSSQTAFHRGL